MCKYLRCICISTSSWELLTIFKLPSGEEQLKFRNSLQGSSFQFRRARRLRAADWHSGKAHSGAVGFVGIQSRSCRDRHSRGNWDGAVLSRKSTGEATSKEVTSNVAVVMAILCTVADVRNQMHGAQHIQPDVS